MNAFGSIVAEKLPEGITTMHSGGYCAQEPGRAFTGALRGYGETVDAAREDLARVVKLVRS